MRSTDVCYLAQCIARFILVSSDGGRVYADVGMYSADDDEASPPRRKPLVLEEALRGRALDDVLLWLTALYQNLGPTSLEGGRLASRFDWPHWLAALNSSS